MGGYPHRVMLAVDHQGAGRGTRAVVQVPGSGRIRGGAGAGDGRRGAKADGPET